jgi:hypothetical protein
MPEALTPTPHHLVVVPTHRQACRLHELQMENVQAVCLPLYFRQQQTTRFSNLHHTGVNVDLVVNLIELANTHDVGRRTRDKVDLVEGPGLAVLAHEHDSPAALNPRHQVIIESYSAEHHCVNHRERRLEPGYVLHELERGLLLILRGVCLLLLRLQVALTRPMP